MKKILKVENLLIAFGILLFLGFVIRLGADFYQVQSVLRFSPFYLFFLERALTFFLPSVLCFTAAMLLKRRNRNK